MKNFPPITVEYPAEWVRFMLQHLVGDNREKLKDLSNIDIDKDSFSDGELFILVSLTIMILDDENFGHCPKKIPAKSIFFAQKTLNSCVTFGEGLTVLCELIKALNVGLNFVKIIDGDICRFQIHAEGNTVESGAAVEISHLVSYIGLFNLFLGRPIYIEKIYSRSFLYTKNIAYHPRLSAPVEFSSFTGVDFAASYLDEPNNAPQSAAPHFEALRWYFLGNKLRPLTERSDLSVFALDDLIASLNAITLAKNVDLRQKRRIAIENHGANLRDIQNARKAVSAVLLLCCTSKPISSIAETLGFSEYASFHRFFRNYIGVTPRDYRSIHGERDTIGDDFAVNFAMKILVSASELDSGAETADSGD